MLSKRGSITKTSLICIFALRQAKLALMVLRAVFGRKGVLAIGSSTKRGHYLLLVSPAPFDIVYWTTSEILCRRLMWTFFQQ